MPEVFIDFKRASYNREPRSIHSDRGSVSAMGVALAYMEAGCWVSQPLGDGQRYDLIVDEGGKLSRVQCKTGRLSPDRGSFSFSVVSSLGKKSYEGEIEKFGVYVSELKAAFSFDAHDYNIGCMNAAPLVSLKERVIFRLNPAKNNQFKGVRWAANYQIGKGQEYINSLVKMRGRIVPSGQESN